MYGLKRKPIDSDLNGLVKIVGSEFIELKDETPTLLTSDERWMPSPDKFVKEGIDVIYAMSQQLRERGVDLDAALAEVHRSNMSKAISIYEPELAHSELIEARKRYPKAELIPNGEYFVLKCAETGKVIKSTTYSPANITPRLYK